MGESRGQAVVKQMSSSGGSSTSSSEEEWVDSQDYGRKDYWEGYYRHHAGQSGTDTEWCATPQPSQPACGRR